MASRQDDKHKNEIDVESWSWGETNAGDAAVPRRHGRRQGRSMQDFHFVMKVNKSSPKLMEACATGKHIKKAVLTCRARRQDQQEYLKITLHGPHRLVVTRPGRAATASSPVRPDQPEFLEDRKGIQGAEVRRLAGRDRQGGLGLQGEQEDLMGHAISGPEGGPDHQGSTPGRPLPIRALDHALVCPSRRMTALARRVPTPRFQHSLWDRLIDPELARGEDVG